MAPEWYKSIPWVLSLLGAGCAARSATYANGGPRPEERLAVEFACGSPGAQGVRVRVADRTGAALPGADVQVRDGPRQLRSAKSDPSGEALFRLDPGKHHVVAVSFVGFHSLTIAPVPVSRGCLSTLAVQLEVASACGPMEVFAQEPPK